MQNAGIDEVTARGTDSAEKMDIPDQIPEKRKKCEQTKDEGTDLTPQQKFGNECLEVCNVIFGKILWRIKKLRDVCDDFKCVTSEALAV